MLHIKYENVLNKYINNNVFKQLYPMASMLFVTLLIDWNNRIKHEYTNYSGIIPNVN